jgi:acyl carrier protein
MPEPGPDHEEIYRKLNQVFHDVFGDDQIVVSPELTARDVSGWDSLRHVRLMLTVERAFGIKFSAYEVNKLKHVGQLGNLIQRKLGAKS